MKKLFTTSSFILSKISIHMGLRFKSLLLILAMLIPLHGCAEVSNTNSDNPASNTPVNTHATWNIATASLLPGDEPPSMEALAIQFGAQIAIDEINASGGIHGSLLLFSVDEATSDFRLICTDTSVECLTLPDDIPFITITKDTFSPSASLDTNPALKAFYDKFQQMYGTAPDFYAVSAYNCIYELKQILVQEDFPLASQ